MNKTLVFLIPVLLLSCTKDPVVPPTKKSSTVCGTPGWPQGVWNIRYEISGAGTPDSIHWGVNIPNPSTSFYSRSIISPSLPLLDSTVFCGDLNSDINIFLYDHDTTHIYNCKIYVNNVLKTNATGQGQLPPNWFYAGAQCQ